MKASWKEQARLKLYDEVCDKPILLMDYVENDINELAINALIMAAHSHESEQYYQAEGAINLIREPAIAAYVEANLREKIAELQAEYADYMRDQAIDARIDERQA